MKLVESEFGKNNTSIEGLTARNEVLSKEIEAQKQRIEILRQALANGSGQKSQVFKKFKIILFQKSQKYFYFSFNLSDHYHKFSDKK